MSYAPRGPGWSQRPQDDARTPGGGSVRAARERIAQSSQRSPQRGGYDPHVINAPLASQFMTARSPRSQPAPSPRMPDFSDDSDSPVQQQWPLSVLERREPPVQPLPNVRYNQTRTNQPPQQRAPYGQSGQQSQYGPYSTQPSSYQDQASYFPMPPNSSGRNPQQPPARLQQDDDHLSPTYNAQSRSLTTSSRDSDASIGSIPDFPVPGAQRKSQGSGPPPAARRGPSSYYSQFSYVSPIKEEAERNSFKSYASSNVIPSNIPEFYTEETPSDTDSPRSGGLGGRSGTLVRQASLGKRAGKPSITTIKSGKSLTPSPPRPEPPLPDPMRSNAPSRLGIDDAVLDPPSPADSIDSLVGRSLELKSSQDSTRPLRPGAGLAGNASMKEMDQILGSLQKGGALSSEALAAHTQGSKTTGTLAERVGARRPPPLDVEAVRKAEARGSLTSLPDLIRRATRLAANLDHGKTASRFGMDWMIREADENKTEKARGSTHDVLRAFPPTDSNAGNGVSRAPWTSQSSQPPLLGSDNANARKRSQAGRRPFCCGLSFRGCAAVTIILFLLVSAAVVIPVVLIVVPQKNAQNQDKMSAAKQMCEQKSPCQNGGSVTIMPDGSCGCLCTNGFTGANCQNLSAVGCATLNAGGVEKATVGSLIPPLMAAASTNFSIPLIDTVLFAQFARLNMTCSTENAIVTFPGFDKRSLYQFRRQAADPTVGPTTTFAITPTSAAPSMASSPSSSAASATPVSGPGAPGTNSTSQEFAKVGILFVLQDSQSTDMAAKAQEKISGYLNAATKDGSTPAVARNLSLGNGYLMNLIELTVTLRNGTVYGDGWNGTVTSAVLAPST